MDQVYLDTTYLNPKYSFPPQPLVIDACAELARRIVNGESIAECDKEEGSGKITSMDGWVKHPVKKEEGEAGLHSSKKEETLVVVGTYSIGKERIVKGRVSGS